MEELVLEVLFFLRSRKENIYNNITYFCDGTAWEFNHLSNMPPPLRQYVRPELMEKA